MVLKNHLVQINESPNESNIYFNLESFKLKKLMMKSN